MKRKIFIIVFCMLLTIQSFGIMTVNASSTLDGDMSVEEGGTQYVSTDADEKLRQEKNEAMQRTKQMRADPDNVYHVLYVTEFEQENGYYCGPATVKQVIHYINGTSASQSTYANNLGTTTAGTNMVNIPGVLNKYVGSTYTYVYDNIGTQSNWCEVITYNSSIDIPVILDIRTTGISAFPYTTSGHFVNTSGVDFRVLSGRVTSKVRITDPWTPGLGNRWYSADNLYAANNNHPRQAFIR